MPTEDVRSATAVCKARILEREGIAMFLALHDSRPGRQLQVHDTLSLSEAARLAELFDHYERGLAPKVLDPVLVEAGIEGETPGDGPTAIDPDADPTGAAALIEILVVLSDQHMRARPELSS